MDTIESRGDSGVSSRASSVLTRQTGTLPRMDSRDLLDSRGSVLVSVSTRGADSSEGSRLNSSEEARMASRERRERRDSQIMAELEGGDSAVPFSKRADKTRRNGQSGSASKGSMASRQSRDDQYRTKSQESAVGNRDRESPRRRPSTRGSPLEPIAPRLISTTSSGSGRLSTIDRIINIPVGGDRGKKQVIKSIYRQQIKGNTQLPPAKSTSVLDPREEMRKEKAKRFNLNKSRISGRRVAITLGANTVAKIKGELRVPHGPVPKGALCDYIEIQKGQDDAVLKFRTPEDLVYNEAMMMKRKKNKLRWQHAYNQQIASRKTKNIGCQTPGGAKGVMKKGGSRHSELYTYRYLTALPYDKLLTTRYIRTKDQPILEQPAAYINKLSDLSLHPIKTELTDLKPKSFLPQVSSSSFYSLRRRGSAIQAVPGERSRL